MKINKSRGSKISDIGLGDRVLVQNMIIPNKLRTTFGRDKYEVVDRKGNEVILLKDGKISRRQVTHLKKVTDKNSYNSTHIEQPTALLTSTESSATTKNIQTSDEDQSEQVREALSDVIRDCPSTPSTPKITMFRDHLTATPSPKVTPLKLKKRRDCGDR